MDQARFRACDPDAIDEDRITGQGQLRRPCLGQLIGRRHGRRRQLHVRDRKIDEIGQRLLRPSGDREDPADRHAMAEHVSAGRLQLGPRRFQRPGQMGRGPGPKLVSMKVVGSCVTAWFSSASRKWPSRSLATARWPPVVSRITPDKPAVAHAELVDVSEWIVIALPTEAVFEFVSSYENDPLWREGISAMTQTPPGSPHVGTRTVEVGRFLGRRLVTSGEVTASEAGRMVAFRGLMAGTPVSSSRTVEPVGERQAAFTYRASAQLRGVYRLLEPLVAASFRRRLSRDLRRLRARLETGAAEH